MRYGAGWSSDSSKQTTVEPTVRFSLEPLGQGTRLTVTDAGHLETQKDLEACVGCAVGWGEALALLKFYLEHGVVYGPVPK